MHKLKNVQQKLNWVWSLFCLWGFSVSAWAESDDLRGVMSSVQATFGPDSTFIKLIYLMDIIVGVYTYHKTKNFAAMLSVIFISVFLTYALPHWVFTA